MLPKTFQAMGLYAEGFSFKEIKKEMNLDHTTQVRRMIQEGCKQIVTWLQDNSDGKMLTKTVTPQNLLTNQNGISP